MENKRLFLFLLLVLLFANISFTSGEGGEGNSVFQWARGPLPDNVERFITDRGSTSTSGFSWSPATTSTLESIYLVRIPFPYNITRELYKDSNDKEYVFEYDEFDKSFILKDFNDDLDYNLSDVFYIPDDFGVSRVALFRSFPSGDKVYGYENAHHNMVSASEGGLSNLLNAVYTLNFENFGYSFTQDLCMNSLATYDPIVLSSGDTKLSYNRMVGCRDKKIILNSKSIDLNFGDGRAFNLFKNIVTNLKNE